MALRSRVVCSFVGFVLGLIPARSIAQQSVVRSGFLPNHGVESGRFGWSVGIDGDRAIAGAPQGFIDNQGRHSGRAFLYQRGASRWLDLKELVPSDSSLLDGFGTLVDVSGEVAAVIGGGDSKLYVFERNQGGPDNWGEAKKISFASPVDAMKVDGDTLIAGVGASSAVVVLRKDAGGPSHWGVVAIRTGPASAGFGRSLALSGDTAAVSSREHVYLLERDEGAPEGWGVKTTIPGGGFVDLSGDTLVVNASRVFERDRGGLDHWGEVARLSDFFPSLPEPIPFSSFAVSRNTVVVGSEDLDPLGNGYNPGAALLFLRDEGGPNQWGVADGITGNDAGFRAHFGQAVAIWNDTVVVGAFLADSGAEDTGAAFVYTIDTAPSTTCSVVPRYYGGTLTLDFTLATSVPLRWELWVSLPSNMVRFWSVTVPAVNPGVTFSVPIPGFPKVGKVGFGSTLTTTTNGNLCADWRVVDTGLP